MHTFILNETYVENPLSRAVRYGDVNLAKQLITVTLPESCKRYDEKRGGKGYYLHHGVNHEFCNWYPMHNTWTLNYLGEKNRTELYADLRELRSRIRIVGSCDEKRWEEREARVAREKLLAPDGTFDFYPSWGRSPLVMCINNGRWHRVEMAEMLLELGARIPQLYDANRYDPNRKQLGKLEKDSLLSMLREDKSGEEIKRHLYQEEVTKNAVHAKGYSMEHNSVPLSAILKDILPEIVKDYEPRKELWHFE